MNYINLPDNQVITTLNIQGRPATKKNSAQIIRSKSGDKPCLLPSKQYQEYAKLALPQLKEQWADNPPIDCGISLEAQIYLPDKRIGDINNYYSALCDLLQSAGVVKDDKYITLQSTGEQRHIDKSNPRVELTICRHRGIFD